MELTRRDALAALAAVGVAGVGAGCHRRDGSPTSDGLREETADALVAAAEVVYPSAVDGIEEFVGTYLDGRFGQSDHRRELEATVDRLDGHAREWHGAPFVELSPGTRETLLREVGADTADPEPDGTTAERVRFYVVNELLYALYTSPTGGRLAGIENPQGHPGGTESYRRGPDR